MSVLVIIPARGGSIDIPRKNLRALNNKPLIYYSIQCALKSKYCEDVYVSSEDDEILSIAQKLGAKTHHRNEGLSKSTTTLDPVIFSAFQFITKLEKLKEYQLVITLQATSPLLTTNSLDQAIEVILNDKTVDTVLAAKDNTHLSWTEKGTRFVPLYTERVNRQFLRPTYTETGAFLITRTSVITKSNRIGDSVELYLLKGGESIDIDTHEDWNICEYYLKKKKILFVVSGNQIIGLGHAYNALLIANDILDHDILFLVDKHSLLAKDKIASKNYQVILQKKEKLCSDILAINPDIVINDILDTSKAYINTLKENGLTVINFEDLGPGAYEADYVVNAIYPEKHSLPNHFFGEKYFILRDEFILATPRAINKTVTRVLLTFGGVDPENLTKKVIDAIYNYCINKNIEIHLIAGFGYTQYTTLDAFDRVNIHHNSSNIADQMMQSDIIFTSAGRTIYEVASLGRPAIVLAQNMREMSHLFANEVNGFIHLGRGDEISAEIILENFVLLVEGFSLRKDNSQKMLSVDLQAGRLKVQKIIRQAIDSL